MASITIFSDNGTPILFPSDHDIFKNPVFSEVNFKQNLPFSYTDLELLTSKCNYDDYSEEILKSHLDFLSEISLLNYKIKLIDYLINKYNDIFFPKYEPYLTPDVLSLKYFGKFPALINSYEDIFTNLIEYNNIIKYHKSNDQIDIKSERFIKMGFIYGCCFGKTSLVDYFMEKGANDWNLGMVYAAEGGHKDLVEFFIEKGANNWNSGMASAAKGGHKDLVEFFIEKGANNWNSGMASAAKGGHKDLVDFFIQKGASNWNLGMVYAAEGGHKDLVEFFIEKGANDWNLGRVFAATGGYEDLVIFFIRKGAYSCVLDILLPGLCTKSH